MSALRVTLTPAEFLERQMREALDGTFIAMHFSGRMIPMKVPADFNPYSKEGQALIKGKTGQKVLSEEDDT